MAIHPDVPVGHIHLSVSNLERSLGFYRDLLGFAITTWYGDSAVFLSAGGYHHHIGLNTWESKDGLPPPFGSTGLYHVAFLYPTRRSLAEAVKTLIQANYPIDGTADHGVSEAVYLRDPDGNGVELYVDRPREKWPTKPDGSIHMITGPLSIESLLAELQSHSE
jgi:catechol 2,3-dioxygenase